MILARSILSLVSVVALASLAGCSSNVEDDDAKSDSAKIQASDNGACPAGTAAGEPCNYPGGDPDAGYACQVPAWGGDLLQCSPGGSEFRREATVTRSVGPGVEASATGACPAGSADEPCRFPGGDFAAGYECKPAAWDASQLQCSPGGGARRAVTTSRTRGGTGVETSATGACPAGSADVPCRYPGGDFTAGYVCRPAAWDASQLQCSPRG
ncbi:hypothetical protein EON77_06360 [bacterium]|nr:MAG: hypothetical protein EON77_06360 [bacterium]